MSIYLGNTGMIMLRRTSGDQEIGVSLKKGSIGQKEGGATGTRKLIIWSEPNIFAEKIGDISSQAAKDWQEYVKLTSLSTGDKITLKSSSALSFIDKNTTGTPQTAETAKSKSYYVYVDDMGSIRLYTTFQKSLSGVKTDAVRLIEITGSTEHKVTISIDGMDYRVLGQVVNYELNTARETIDITSLADQFRKQYSALITGSGRFTCHWDYANLGVSNRYVSQTQQTSTTRDENYQEIPNYLNQLLLRSEIGSEFLAHFFLKTSNGQAGTGDDQVWYNLRGILTNVAMQFNIGDTVQMTADFITTGAFYLQSATETEYNLLLESGDDLLKDQDDSKVVSSTET